MTSEPKLLESFASRPACIVVAEEDSAMRSLLCNALGKVGYDVQEIASATEVEAFLRDRSLRAARDNQARVDIIVTAMSLPGKTALDVLSEFKYSNHEVPIILITAFGDPQIAKDALERGATAVFDKPFDIRELADYLTRLTPPSVH